MPYAHQYNPRGGPLTIHGVALGNTRFQVESRLGTPRAIEGPAYSSYGAQDEFVVLYRPGWPRIAPEEWRVQLVLGTVLEQDGRILLRTGDDLEQVRRTLGAPLATSKTRDGLLTLEYPGGYVMIDPATRKVRDVALKHYNRGRAV